jgi:sulfate/thiosulfate transport system ATP-binding protein
VTHDQEEALEVADRVVLMNRGVVEQIGSPQDVWDHPASPFVYGFLGDVNLFHGRAHEGEIHLGAGQDGIRLDSPEHRDAQHAKAFAYVRPHDLDVHRYVAGEGTGTLEGQRGIIAKLSHAIVVGPTARLELTRVKGAGSAHAGDNDIIEAHIPAQQFRELDLRDGETLVLTPRKARVFVEQSA